MKKVLAGLFIVLVLQSCVPLVVGTGIYGGKLLAEDKTVGETISDKTIWTKIRTKIINQKLDKVFGDINVKVNEGKVLLTGTVQNRELIVSILRICWSTQGVKEVINELKVSQEEFSVTNYASDSWITTKARSKLLFSNVKSINFSLETIDGTVYVIGIAQSQNELNSVIKLLSGISRVKKVIPFVRVNKELDDKINDTRTASQYKRLDHSTFSKDELSEETHQNINNDIDQSAFTKHTVTTDNLHNDSIQSSKEVKITEKSSTSDKEIFDNNF